MNDQQKHDHLHDVDKVLNDVREQLALTSEQGDQYELRALQLLLVVTKAMHSQRNAHILITLILDSALSFAEADRAFLMLLDENGEPRFKMGRSYDGEYLTQDQFIISTGIVHEALNSPTPLIVADAQTNDAFSARESIRNLHLRTVMAGRLWYKGDVLGLIYVDSKRPLARFSKHHLNVLMSLADQAAVAIVNARKFETHQG